ncbi:hypothetical protein ZIOFF_072634 [Zingiber officinale]|uniref:Uncharacterized protein n=1 Tax=Zingiber officinale TaxID=94328 RepID=A0A8J5BXJ0_ZINOF|nr:hypothetical protein ZIOFF_072634 [Zingiber officinale]
MRLAKANHLIIVHIAQSADAADNGMNVADGLDDVTSADLALGADHGGALADAAEGLGQKEIVLVDVLVICTSTKWNTVREKAPERPRLLAKAPEGAQNQISIGHDPVTKGLLETPPTIGQDIEHLSKDDAKQQFFRILRTPPYGNSVFFSVWKIDDPIGYKDDSLENVKRNEIKVIDLLVSYQRGGKIGLFDGAGVGKTGFIMELMINNIGKGIQAWALESLASWWLTLGFYILGQSTSTPLATRVAQVDASDKTRKRSNASTSMLKLDKE